MSRLGRLRAGIVLGAVALLLAGCSGSGGESTAGGQTRTVKDVAGTEIEVPADPQRVVTLSEPTLDATLALGVTPVGIISGRGQSSAPSYLKDQASGLKVVGGVAQPNLETIKGVEPDLILVDGTSINNNQPLLDTLSQIAPVVNTGLAGGDWKKNLEITAAALNKSAAGEKLVADYTARVATVTSELGANADATISIVRWSGGGPSLILKELIPGRVVSDLGLKRPPSQDRNGRGHSEPISAENISEIDADWVFFGTLGGSTLENPKAGGDVGVAASQQAIRTAAIETPGFMDLTAMQQGHIVPVDGSVWTSSGGPILVNKILADLTETLTAQT